MNANDVTDYTNSQTLPVSAEPGMAKPHVSEEVSERAELEHQRRFGPRNMYNHVKATEMPDGPWHLSPRFCGFLEFRWNITVFYLVGLDVEPVGWLYHYEIQRRAAPCSLGEGRDVYGPFRPVSSYDPPKARASWTPVVRPAQRRVSLRAR